MISVSLRNSAQAAPPPSLHRLHVEALLYTVKNLTHTKWPLQFQMGTKFEQVSKLFLPVIDTTQKTVR